MFSNIKPTEYQQIFQTVTDRNNICAASICFMAGQIWLKEIKLHTVTALPDRRFKLP
jgi:hypothetical protein